MSDDDSAYVELQAGLFRNQETYAFLEPHETVRFSEYWLPVPDLGGITRATEGAVLAMTRPAPTAVHLALDVTRDLPDARIVVRHGGATALDRRMTLTPKAVWRLDLHDVPAGEAVTVELADASGAIVLRHTEGSFDRTPASEVRLGPTDETSASPERESISAILARGTADELNGRRLSALDAYRRGLTHDPSNASLLKAAGRLALALGWVESGNDAAIAWLRAASATDPTDAELGYYLGVALAAAGRVADARPHLEAARRFRGTRVQATLQLSRLDALDGRLVPRAGAGAGRRGRGAGCRDGRGAGGVAAARARSPHRSPSARCATGATSTRSAACCATNPRCWANWTKTSGLILGPTPIVSSTSRTSIWPVACSSMQRRCLRDPTHRSLRRCARLAP